MHDDGDAGLRRLLRPKSLVFAVRLGQHKPKSADEIVLATASTLLIFWDLGAVHDYAAFLRRFALRFRRVAPLFCAPRRLLMLWRKASMRLITLSRAGGGSAASIFFPAALRFTSLRSASSY